MFPLNAPAISCSSPERDADEILNALFKRFFNGEPHKSLLGDVTFPVVDCFFNQALIPSPQDTPQLHTVLTSRKARELWVATGNLSDWETELANPASGINYGVAHGHIEEAVSGRLCRRIPGTNIRWRFDLGTGNLLEEVLADSQWTTIRTFEGATEIRWTRPGLTFYEQVRRSNNWETVREVNTASIWDGSKKMVDETVTFSIFVRVRNTGNNDARTDAFCRSVAANVETLFKRADVRSTLAGKGMRHTRIIAGPTPMESHGLRVRHLVLETHFIYLLPVLL